MKEIFYLLIHFTSSNTVALAQETIADEELQKYAVAMDPIDTNQKSLIEPSENR